MRQIKSVKGLLQERSGKTDGLVDFVYDKLMASAKWPAASRRTGARKRKRPPTWATPSIYAYVRPGCLISKDGC